MNKPRKQFSRPAISVDPVNREWRDVLPSKVKVGDTVADFGKVEEVDKTPSGAYLLCNVLGNRTLFSANTPLRAFVAVKSS